MSFAFVMTLPNAVILAADGMVTAIDGAGTRLLASDVDKIEPLGPSAFAIRFGIEEISGAAISDVRAGPLSSPAAINRALSKAVDARWKTFLKSGRVDPLNDALAVGVYAAGLVQGTPFVSAQLRHGSQEEPSASFTTEIGVPFVIGFNSREMTDNFLQQLARVVRPYWRNPDRCIEQLLDVAGKGIRRAEREREGEVGGTIRYAIVKRGKPVVKGIWKDKQAVTL